MKNFIVGGVIGLILIAIGIGMSTGRIKIPGSTPGVDTATTTATSTTKTVSIEEKKFTTQEGKVTYTLVVPEVTNAPILKKNIEDYVASFKKSIAQAALDINFEGASSNYSLNINYDVIRNDAQIIVLKMSAYEFTGGAHGNPSFAFFQYDIRQERMIGEEEIFVDRKNKELFTFVLEAFLKKPEYVYEDGSISKSVFFDAGEDREKFLEALMGNGNVAFTKDGILFKYGAYAIGPYVIGEPEIIIPYGQIEPFLSTYAKSFFK
jgi:hypothetical protein